MSVRSMQIMVTRPMPAGAVLCQKIDASGDHAIYFPTLVFMPPADSALAEEQLAALDQYDWLIFISPQAVYAAQDKIHALWSQFPASVKIAAIGAGTVAALQLANLPVVLYPQTNWNSEGLLDLPEFQAIAGKKIALLCGEGGREWLAENLALRGADVTSILLYQRALPDIQPAEYANLLQARQIDVVVCTSGEGLRNLKTLFQSVWPDLQNVLILVISPTMQALAEELGFHKIFLAKNPSHDAIMEALSQISASQDQKGFLMENQQADKNVSNEEAYSAPEPRKRGCPQWVNIGIFFTAFAIVVLLATSYIGYNRLIKNNQELAGLATSLNNKIVQDQADIAGLQKIVTETAQNVQTSVASQQQAIGEIRSAQQGKKESWSVSEAQYLANLANDNLQIGDNLTLVVSLLQTADQKLRDLSDANVLPIRKALAGDIAALQGVPAADLAGVYVQLSALNAQVDKLALPNKRPASVDAPTTANSDKPLSWWRNGLHQSWEVLQKIVVVRYSKPGERPFIPPEQQDYLYQNLHATFEQALSAVVHRQPEIYKASLEQAAAWIQQYFIVDSPATQAELAALKQLQSVTLRPELPTISASLQAFHDYFAQTDAVEKSAETPANQS
jgi:uncharacterized protein HemX/uroporphyrinogen-III synthase